MSESTDTMTSTEDITDKERKADHINLAFDSVVPSNELDDRFDYEPMLSAHANAEDAWPKTFLGKKMKWPIWVSSMTGGTDHARTINHNLARACGQFGLGMGLGSCRMLLKSDERLVDFDVRHLIGDDLPLYANLGIAQVEQLVTKNAFGDITILLDKLKADGLIIHVNPMQEWLQPEGDHIDHPPIDTIQRLMDGLPGQYIVKEVGQGFGPESMEALLKLPLEAIEFAAHGGTNFAMLELMRSEDGLMDSYGKLTQIGHSATQMVDIANQLLLEMDDQVRCKQLILSGGVKDFLDGFYLMGKSNYSSIYGQASGFLKYANGSYSDLAGHIERQLSGLQLAKKFLRIK